MKTTAHEFLNKNKDISVPSVLDQLLYDKVLHTVKIKDNTLVKYESFSTPHGLRKEQQSQLDILLKANILNLSISVFASQVLLIKTALSLKFICLYF